MALNDNDKYNILFLDSGFGGIFFALDVLSLALKNLDAEFQSSVSFTYVGDTKNVPYGQKTPSEVKFLAKNLFIKALKVRKFDLVIVACNTICSILDEEFLQDIKLTLEVDEGLPAIINIIDFSAKYVKQNCPGPVIYLATKVTVESMAYEKRLFALESKEKKGVNAGNSDGKSNICPIIITNWVNAIEFEDPNNEKSMHYVRKDVELVLQKLQECKAKYVALFCTHFVYYRTYIRSMLEQNGFGKVEVISQGEIFYPVIKSLFQKKRLGHSLEQQGGLFKISAIITGNGVEKYKSISANFAASLKMDNVSIEVSKWQS